MDIQNAAALRSRTLALVLGYSDFSFYFISASADPGSNSDVPSSKAIFRTPPFKFIAALNNRGAATLNQLAVYAILRFNGDAAGLISNMGRLEIRELSLVDVEAAAGAIVTPDGKFSTPNVLYLSPNRYLTCIPNGAPLAKVK